ncbi:MAG: hypothetical protein M3Y76_07655 [Chloroflexota bacterium]|nr:hypothetical protein [Chloroflexota bacterium]
MRRPGGDSHTSPGRWATQASSPIDHASPAPTRRTPSPPILGRDQSGSYALFQRNI